MKQSIFINGKELIIKKTYDEINNIVKYDFYNQNNSITKNIGFTFPKDFFSISNETKVLIMIEEEINRRIDDDIVENISK